MGCGACSKRKSARNNNSRAIKNPRSGAIYDVMGGYKTLPTRQLKTRLEVFKKLHCPTCVNRYECDFARYSSCKIRPR